MEFHDLRAALRIRTKYYKLLGRQALNISNPSAMAALRPD